MQKYENNFIKRYNILKMFTKHANNWVFRNIIPFIDNHKIRAKKVVLEIFELLLTQRWHKYHFIGLHNQKKKSENYRCFQCQFMFSHTFILGFLNFVVPNLFLSSFCYSNKYWLSSYYEQSVRFQEKGNGRTHAEGINVNMLI